MKALKIIFLVSLVQEAYLEEKYRIQKNIKDRDFGQHRMTSLTH